MSLRPRRAFHRGSVLASGLVLDVARLGFATARARVLRLSVHNAAVFRMEGALFVRFAFPMRVSTGAVGGAPVVRQGNLHAAAPLDDDEVTALDAGVEAVVTVHGGVASVWPVADQAREDLADWLDVTDFEVCPSALSLGASVAPSTTRLAPPVSDARKQLGVAPLSHEGASFLAAVGAERPVLRDAGSLANRVRTAVAAAWTFVSELGRRLRGSAGQAHDPAAGPPASEPLAPSLWGRLWGVFTRLVISSRLAGLIGRRQAAYLARMLELFEQRDLDEALRHAIPLSKELEGALAPPALPALGVPSPRERLAIVPHRARGGASSLGVGEGLFELLRATYRRAFDRLVALGEFEKAAFILAELLNASEEAVSFLERHGRRVLAAEVAEARGLPPGLVVRQWFLAGHRERAVAVARRTGAFADAVLRLEATDKSLGQALRLVWADHLADCGDYAAAVDVAWAIAAARPTLRVWLERAVAVGGETGARMLVRTVRAQPEALEVTRDRIVSLLAAEEGGALARAVGREVLSEKATGGVRVFAKLAARRLVALGVSDGGGADARRPDEPLVRRLLDAAGDAAFRADVLACKGREAPLTPLVAVHVRAYALTDIGACRDVNEDTAIATTLREARGGRAAPAPSERGREVHADATALGLLLGAIDAMGGVSSGDAAADMARRALFERLQTPRAASSLREAAERLAATFEAANGAIFSEATKNPARRGMGCAATAATTFGSTLLVGQVGDTRGYILRGGSLVQVTRDHSLLNEYIAAGHLMTPEAIEEFPHKNVITRAMGMAASIEADLVRVELCRGDVVLLCSDGLTSVVSDAGVRDLLQAHEEPEHACVALVRAAIAAGAPDNIAVVVARFDGDTLPEPTLPIDVGPIVGPSYESPSAHPAVVKRRRADSGAFAVHDAALLPDGRVLVALGELGVRLLSRHGKTLARFGEPAHRLIMSDHGDRAILVAFRGEMLRLAKLDVLGCRVRPWCDAPAQAFATTFDGGSWFVAQGGRLLAIDALQDGWEHLWTVDEPATAIRFVAREEGAVSAYFERTKGEGAELWTFDPLALTLRGRTELAGAAERRALSACSGDGVLAGWWRSDVEQGPLRALIQRGGGIARQLPVTAAVASVPPWLSSHWVAFPTASAEGTAVYVFAVASQTPSVVVQLDGALSSQDAASAGVGLRFQQDRAVLFDAKGRLLVVSLPSGAVVQELRVS